MRIQLFIRPRTVGIILAIISLYLAAQSIFGEYVQATLLSAKLDSIPAVMFDEFSVNAESTIPNWYSMTILLVAGVLLALITAAKYRSNAPYRRYWLVLAIIFVYLSIDEGAAVHEIFSDPVHSALHTSGYLEFGWQLAVAPLLIIVGLAYLRFVFHLPPRTRNLFILSGVIYVAGAFFGDAVQANQLASDGGQTLTLLYLAIGTVEELMEMLGIALFIYTLLAYMTDMHYTYEFLLPGLPDLPLQQPEGQLVPASAPAGSFAISDKTKRLAALLVVTIVLFNAGLLYWGVTQAESAPVAAGDTSLPVYQAIISEYPAADLTVTHINGPFSKDNESARKVVPLLLSSFSQVMVVSLPAEQSAIVFAGNTLPFDRDSLASVLRSSGETQFIIYDGPAVNMVIGNASSPAGK